MACSKAPTACESNLFCHAPARRITLLDIGFYLPLSSLSFPTCPTRTKRCRAGWDWERWKEAVHGTAVVNIIVMWRLWVGLVVGNAMSWNMLGKMGGSRRNEDKPSDAQVVSQEILAGKNFVGVVEQTAGWRKRRKRNLFCFLLYVIVGGYPSAYYCDGMNGMIWHVQSRIGVYYIVSGISAYCVGET
ncbi:hypothetical protein B0J18DRAFT_101301 [Chaetomium sp. MPI-SDFR-AT-0129]|nr:hypothetical protein B0J18DRAFT_101301 [Chaetomium sp. MPI-SDFR-AT-0129]